jgi:hypothetical protein
MKTQLKTAIASVTGAAALTLAVGFGAVGAGPAGGAATAPTHPTPGVLATQPAPIVQHATLTGCIIGENC